MREIEYRSLPGLESEQIAEQLDAYELLYSTKYPLKDKWLFDFSTPITTRSTKPTWGVAHMWDNMFESYPFGIQTGFSATTLAYNAAFIFKNNYRGSDVPEIETVPDISGEYNAPYTSGDMALFLSHSEPDSFGTLPPKDLFKVFRSGYLEFTIKTNKNNSVIAVGNTNYSPVGGGIEGPNANDPFIGVGDAGSPSFIDQDNAYLNDPGLNNLFSKILIQDGKLLLTYENVYGNNKKYFEISGNQFIADGEWHHIVINFAKPGTFRTRNKKYNKRAIEFWVDGFRDVVNEEYLNNSQVFFPTFTWLWMDPYKIDKKRPVNTMEVSSASTINEYISSSSVNPPLFDEDQYIDSVNIFNYFAFPVSFNNFYSRNLSGGMEDSFVGSMHTFAHGINVPLSFIEIKERLRWWKQEEKNSAPIFSVYAEIVSPTITANKKKALRLFWNYEDLKENKNGVELDNNFIYDSISVTHKTRSSTSESFNLDLSRQSNKKILSNVRVVVTSNLSLWGPGKENVTNLGSFGYPEQINPELLSQYNSLAFNDFVQGYSEDRFTDSSYQNLYFGGIELQKGDRILLTNQFDKRYNGIYVFDSMSTNLRRAEDSNSPSKINGSIVYVSDGHYKDTHWMIENSISTLNDPQEWIQVMTDSNLIGQSWYPILGSRWSDEHGDNRFVDINSDIDLSSYDVVTFINYPENDEDIARQFVGYDNLEIKNKYNNFITSLKIAAANGASIMVTSTKLAQDLEIVKEFTAIEQEFEDGDGRSSVVNPFQFDEPAERYFDTHRQNAYHLDTPVPGLTDRETWVLTEAINYIPKDEYDYEQWHLKYSYRQFGLQEGNEFLIPSLALRQVATKSDLPGFRSNSRAAAKLNVVAPHDVLAGTVVTSLANTHYHGASIANNEYDDYATTIIVHNGQQLGGTPINGKIFVNCVEDAYTMSREDYNKAVIQVIPNDDPYETISTKQWQYSTSRLNRLPKRVNVKELTAYGQTTPTNGGGGPLVQAATNSSNGIIRSETDRGNKDYQSDLYPLESEEVYPIQEIPVLSMTWLGLQWLAGN